MDPKPIYDSNPIWHAVEEEVKQKVEDPATGSTLLGNKHVIIYRRSADYQPECYVAGSRLQAIGHFLKSWVMNENPQWRHGRDFNAIKAKFESEEKANAVSTNLLNGRSEELQEPLSEREIRESVNVQEPFPEEMERKRKSESEIFPSAPHLERDDLEVTENGRRSPLQEPPPEERDDRLQEPFPFEPEGGREGNDRLKS